MEMAAGMCAMIGYAGGAPTTTGQVYPDPMGGYNGAAAVMTALMHRQKTGEGQYIELSQVEASMQFIGEELLLRDRSEGRSRTARQPRALGCAA